MHSATNRQIGHHVFELFECFFEQSLDRRREERKERRHHDQHLRESAGDKPALASGTPLSPNEAKQH